jgi:hypothetical protein
MEKWLVLPVFCQVVLTLVVGFMTGYKRFNAVRGGRAKVKDIALNAAAWPDDVLKIANNFNNQFQVPTVFMATSAVILALGKVDAVTVVLAWFFVLSRIVHAVIHITHNVIMRRFQAYIAGLVGLGCIWAWLMIRLFVLA